MKEQMINIPIGEIIKEEAEKRGMKTPELAERLKVSERYVFMIYNKTSIETRLLIKISNVLGVNFFAKYIVYDEEAMKDVEELEKVIPNIKDHIAKRNDEARKSD